MQIILTGALGHIGSHLLRNFNLIDENVTFVAVDSLLTERYPSLFNLESNRMTRFFAKNISKNLAFLEPFGKTSSMIIHLAALNNMDQVGIDEETLVENNLRGTQNIIEYAARYNLPIIFPSSTSVYGVSGIDLKEDSELGNTENPYARIKKLEENLNNKYFADGGTGAILRLGTIHGTSSGMRFHTAINKFCFQIMVQEPIEVWETALTQYRPYLGIQDFGRALTHLITNKLLQGDTYNLASSNYRMNDLLSIFEEILGQKLNISLVRSLRMNHLDIAVSCQKIERTNFHFTSDVKRDISETLSVLGAQRE